MSALGTLVRSWPMLGSLGAGLVLTALAAGAELLPGLVLAGCGVAALGWGVLALRAGRALAPRTTIGVTVVLLLTSAALAANGLVIGQGIPVLPLVAAAALAAVVALGAAAEMRPRRRRRSTFVARRAFAPGSAGILRTIGLLVGATLVAAVATPALAATDAGRVAVPHGEIHGPTHEHR